MVHDCGHRSDIWTPRLPQRLCRFRCQSGTRIFQAPTCRAGSTGSNAGADGLVAPPRRRRRGLVFRAMHPMRRLRQGLSIRVDYVSSAEWDAGDFCGPNTVLSLRGCALYCGLCYRGVASCRRARADTNGSRVCLAPSLHGRAGVPCLCIEMSHGCLIDGLWHAAACGGG